MIPFKQIGDGLNVSEYNAIVYLLRKNSPFTDKIKIKDGSIFGEYGEYIFDLDMVTIVDNGILITKETLSNIGTVKLNNPIFPNSTYTLNMKVYSMDNINVLEEDDAEIIITPLSITLSEGEEVNIPFETLDLTNIIAFDATISIEHTGIVKSNYAYISVDSVDKAFPNVSVPLTATYHDGAGELTPGKIVNFYDGNDVLIGTATTDKNGVATIQHSWDSEGTYSFYASSDSIISSSKTIKIVSTGDFIFTINGTGFETYTDTPFSFAGDGLNVDFGDGTTELYTAGKLAHNYSSEGEYDVEISGTVTQLKRYCFRNFTNLTSITLPDSITTLEYYSFAECHNLTTIVLPKNLEIIGDVCFAKCYNLSSITLPEGVKTLGSNCFFYCSSLRSIDIPASVTNIGEYFVEGCRNLVSIQLNWDSASDIIQYNSSWLTSCYAFLYFLIPEGTTSLYTAKGYPANRLREEGQGFDDISVSSTQDILSYADGDSTVLSAQLTSSGSPVSVSGESVTFEVRKQSDDSLVETLTDTTDNTGLASVEYFGKGTGDLYIEVSCRTLSKTYDVEDCVDVISDETDQTSKFGSSIGLRNNGTSNISYDSTNKYYSVNITKSSSESFLPINSCTGLDDTIIEFDGYLTSNDFSFVGLCFYKENNNWGRLGTKVSAMEYGGNTNGSYSESDVGGTSTLINTWLHYKFIITNDTVHRQVYNGSTLIYEDTRTYTGFFTSNTKYGLTALWNTSWHQYFKNIKIKSL